MHCKLAYRVTELDLAITAVFIFNFSLLYYWKFRRVQYDQTFRVKELIVKTIGWTQSTIANYEPSVKRTNFTHGSFPGTYFMAFSWNLTKLIKMPRLMFKALITMKWNLELNTVPNLKTCNKGSYICVQALNMKLKIRFQAFLGLFCGLLACLQTLSA